MPKKNYNTFGPYKRNGKWFFKYEEPGSETATKSGKPRLLSGGTFTTKTICESNMKAKDREINDPDYLRNQEAAAAQAVKDAKRAKAEDYGERWLGLQAKRKVNTARNYTNSVRNYFIPYFRGKWVHEITPSDVQEFIIWLEGQRAPGTVRTIMLAISALLHQAERDGALDKVPVGKANGIKLPRRRKSKNRPFKDAETDLIVKTIDEWVKPLTLVLATTGMRCGEAFALTWDRIDLEAGTAYVDRQVQDGRFCSLKGERGESLRPFTALLPPVTVKALRAHRKHAKRMVVEWEHDEHEPEEVEMVTVSKTGLVLYEQLFQDPWYRTLDALAWPRKGNGPHRLRHAFAVGLIEDGASPAEVKAALNHSAITVTLNEYGDHWDNDDPRLRNRVNARFARLDG
ncbi:tyrosine-type recombinase/integrase [Actinomadura terrae]|uniref:tyrosine-type recombinase/integrase n=1 Tax=Actinomadura terrae TaxID=604353 RepID=UPI001FA7AB21|nr:tyrosine-type recombinase/integrase [Actinomadura terrae]